MKGEVYTQVGIPRGERERFNTQVGIPRGERERLIHTGRYTRVFWVL